MLVKINNYFLVMNILGLIVGDYINKKHIMNVSNYIFLLLLVFITLSLFIHKQLKTRV